MTSIFKFALGFIGAGFLILFTLWWTNIADYMYLEDQSLEYSQAAKALWQLSPGERLLSFGGISLLALGLLLMAFAIYSRPRGRSG